MYHLPCSSSPTSGLPVGMAPTIGVHGRLNEPHALVQGTRAVVHATGLHRWPRWKPEPRAPRGGWKPQRTTDPWFVGISYPLVNVYITMERSTMLLMGKLTISMAIFNSELLNYQRVIHMQALLSNISGIFHIQLEISHPVGCIPK